MVNANFYSLFILFSILCVSHARSVEIKVEIHKSDFADSQSQIDASPTKQKGV